MIKEVIGEPYISRRTFLNRTVGASIAAIATLAGCGEHASEPAQVVKADFSKPMVPARKVKVLRSQIVSLAAFYIAQERGYFRDEGIEVEVQPSTNASDALVLLSTNQVDFVHTALGSALLNAASAGLDLRVILSLANVAAGDASSGILVRKQLIESGAYKSMADLRKRKFAVFSEGSTSAYVADLALRKSGLTLNDVELVSMPYPDMAVALTNGAIDAAQELEPFSTILREQGVVEQVASSGDLAPGLPVVLLLASPKLLAEQPEVAQRMVTAILRGMRDYHRAIDLGQGGRDEILAILAKYASIKDVKMLGKIGLPHVDPEGRFDMDAVNKMQDFFVARGAQKARTNLEKLVDWSALDAAVGRLGPMPT